MRVSGLRHLDRCRSAEIPDETVQRVAIRQIFSIVISRYGEDRTRIELIRLVKLSIVFRNLSIEIYTIAQDIEKRRVLTRIRVGIEIRLHALRDKFLGDGVLDATHVSVQMESEFLLLNDCFVVSRGQYGFEIELVRLITCWRRERPEMGIAFRLLVKRELTGRGRSWTPEYMTSRCCCAFCWHLEPPEEV